MFLYNKSGYSLGWYMYMYLGVIIYRFCVEKLYVCILKVIGFLLTVDFILLCFSFARCSKEN